MPRTIKFAKAGGPEVLQFLETEVPAPGPTEVRISARVVFATASAERSSSLCEVHPTNAQYT